MRVDIEDGEDVNAAIVPVLQSREARAIACKNSDHFQNCHALPSKV